MPPTTPSSRLTDSRLANLAARQIYDGFCRFRGRFQEITCLAQKRFEEKDWHAQRADSLQRLNLYREIVDRVVIIVEELLGERRTRKVVWSGMKAVYSGLIDEKSDWELGETFFNSITRRIFTTVGVDPQIEFVDPDYDLPPLTDPKSLYTTYYPGNLDETVQQMLLACQLNVPFANFAEDCRQISDRLRRFLEENRSSLYRIDVVNSLFFRGKGAYLIGRIYTPQGLVPLSLVLLQGKKGIFIDAVLLDQSSVSILFSFTRAYFHVMVERPSDLVQFIRSILPLKRVAEIYISLGYNKHGKTELYRTLLNHFKQSQAPLEIAPGQRGMVMTVFTPPDLDVVFKLIKDRFAPPKKTTRQDVMRNYDLVFRHDRAGRLIDAQSYEFLEFKKSRFQEALLTELLEIAGNTVRIAEDEDTVVVSYAYVERQVTPLDIFLKQADTATANHIIIDYGQAIKDLAVTNIFAGDMLLKNFGVTRHGRVVFYDYDELRPLTECNFRKFPQAMSYEDELAAEPWFHIAENDVFPEEFLHFMGLPNSVKDTFLQHHSDLLDATFWQETQQRILAGEIITIRPYLEQHRLPQPSDVLDS
ncbi:bifunctional isocitrate dehydrogenase kinase/phosphatase [Candidatus Leptofilum sp.]|uniref:bifunctional isocitrate dehydrogenase kinase/phosphatase n=1 Tax=Candidatus Leptofilum sp. TaxID=3241576 RepID=UPI003B5CA40E